jgi:3-oxoacyl-[acyl-carrier-protein] synthase III
MPSVIVATGRHVPDQRLTNEALSPLLSSDPAWILERTGIEARRFAAATDTTTSLAAAAATQAMQRAGWGPGDIDALIFATLSPDLAFPGCGVLLQHMLGLPHIPALDVRNQCSGYLYALQVARAWIEAGIYRRVLIVGSEVHSAGMDMSPAGRAISVLFGDGAGAVLLERGEEVGRGVLDVRLGANGAHAEALWCEAPGARMRPHITANDLARGRHYPQMLGRAVFRHAIEILPREIERILTDHHILPGSPERDALWFIPHQANRRINEHLVEQLGLNPERTLHTIVDYGNTTAASIPMALDVALTEREMGPGAMVLHAAFGSGFTWGTALIRM